MPVDDLSSGLRGAQIIRLADSVPARSRLSIRTRGDRIYSRDLWWNRDDFSRAPAYTAAFAFYRLKRQSIRLAMRSSFSPQRSCLCWQLLGMYTNRVAIYSGKGSHFSRRCFLAK